VLLLAEGIAVGVPVYFATGSRWKAIWYAAISGMSEPVGALIGLAVHLSGHLNLVAMGM
jgi:ZIP family zinc transporter